MAESRVPRLRAALPEEGYHRDLISCQQACPVRTDARGYVRAVAEGRFEEAYLIARGPNPFASICGRVCGAPCEAACRRGRIPRVDDRGVYLGEDRPVAIRALKRFVCERYGVEACPPAEVWKAVRSFVPRAVVCPDELAALLQGIVDGRLPRAHGQGVAVVGSGPAGLAAAHDLALLGFSPVVFEREPVPAGMLYLGVPEYRLPRELIRREVAVIEALGVEIRCGLAIGEGVSLSRLRREFAAVILAVGAKRSRSLGIPGEHGPGVYGGVDLLRAVALGEPLVVGSEVVVIGGGNVAYDAARTVVRQAAYDAARTAARLPGTPRVRLVALETLEEMPAETEEIREGDEEGIIRLNGWGPVEIQRVNGRVTGVKFRRCLRVYDEEHRFAPVFVDSEQLVVPASTVILAVGQATDLSFLEDGGEDVEQARPGWPKVDPETLATTAPGVFVAGDLAHGTRLLIDAVASGKRAARSVYSYVTGRTLSLQWDEVFLELPGYARERSYELLPRQPIPKLLPEQRLGDLKAQVEVGYDEPAARREAARCLDCGVTPVFDSSRCILCGGCADVCPTSCLKLVSLDQLELQPELGRLINAALGEDMSLEDHSAILKDEDRCIRCALCVMRCPTDAIAMERVHFRSHWRAS